MTEKELAIMNEAFMIGRIYATGGEKETPVEIHNKLVEKCEIVSKSDFEPLIRQGVSQPVQKGRHEEKYEKFRDYVLEREKEGKIVIATFDGFAEANIDEIIKQPTEGLLYDLNRDKVTILTFIEDKKWVNDYACMKVIEKLKALLSA